MVIKNPYVHDGVRIHYRDVGTGRPVVFVHGFGASLDSWRFMEEALRAEYRLILMDLKGHGNSDRPYDSGYSIHDQARIVVGLIKHLGLVDTVIVGHSLGSAIALLVALEAENVSHEMVRGLILIGGSIDLNNIPLHIRILRNPVVAWLILNLTSPSFRTRMVLKMAYYDDSKVTDSVVEMYAGYQRIPGTNHALVKTAEQIVPPNYDQLKLELGKLRLPVVNIWGEHDEIVKRTSAEGICTVLPRCVLLTLDGVGHVPHEETPEKVIPLLKKYIREFYQDG